MIAESSQFDRMEQQNQDTVSEINQDRHTSYSTKTKATKEAYSLVRSKKQMSHTTKIKEGKIRPYEEAEVASCRLT